MQPFVGSLMAQDPDAVTMGLTERDPLSIPSNTKDCFRYCVGKTVRGVLFSGNGDKTLILDDGTGLTINSHGAYWITSKGNVDIAIRDRLATLEQNKRDIEEALQAAGATNPLTNMRGSLPGL